MTAKRSAKGTLEAIERSADEDEAERILALGDEELDRELEGAGFDTAARARGEALADKLGVSGRAGSAPAPIPMASRLVKPPGKRWVVLLAAAAVGLVAVGGAVPLIARLTTDKGTREARAPTNADLAAEFRRSAARACAQHRWDDCARVLDDAKAIDLAGEESAEVQALRRALEEARPGP